jgi:signal transduction histidine kinase
LTVVKGAVETHGGSLELLPREGGGLIARIELPLDQAGSA